jgi:hypothetical protein
LAPVIAALDLVFFSLFVALPTLALESAARNKLGDVVIGGGLILALLSVPVVGMLMKSGKGNFCFSSSAHAVQTLAGLALVAFPVFVVSYVINLFWNGI